jgi:predicted TIM-barrel fold metal-dependent hydrolase
MPKLEYGAIDCVVNVFTPTNFDRGQVATDETFRDKIRMRPEDRGGVPIEKFIEKMDRAGIERSFIIAYRNGDMRVEGSKELPYEDVYAICQQYPDRFSGLAGIDPTRGMQGLRDLERAIKEYGFVGAHLYPHWFGWAPDHAKYYPYYAKCCELDVSIMMQMGINMVYSQKRRLPSVAQPIKLDQVAIDFPELPLIGIHIGWPWHHEMIGMAWKHPNIYIGLDAYAPKHWPPEIVHYANTFGQDKVIFGSDWPVIDPERAMDEIHLHDFRPGPLRKVLRDNAYRIFKLDERLKSGAKK